ncbi:MAG: hypothetical protein WA663_06335 [Candidatus Acidiferrales bacterium]
MNRRNRFSVTLISATLLGMLTCSTATSAKNPKNSKPTTPDVTSIKIGNVTLKGIPYDYSWTHVVFPDPGSEENAIRNGTHDRWLKIVNDPRYIIQQLHRGQPVRGPNAAEVAAFEKYVRKNNTLASRVTPKAPLAGAQESTKKAPAKIEGASPKGKSAIASTPQVAAQSKAGSAGAVADWQVGMEGSGGSGTGVDGISPNTAGVSYTNSIGAPSCSADWEAFVTGQYTTSTPLQASIVGFNNLYSTCSGSIPSVLFAYEIETSDGVMLEAQSSPVISYYDSGQQLAFIATDRTAQQSYLVLLQWEGSSMEPSGTLASPTVLSPSSASTYASGCSSPCDTILALSNSGYSLPNEAPYVDYETGQLFVGDSAGYLHRFTGIFTGTLAEDTGGAWPVGISAGVVSAPVYDSLTCEVFVGTSDGDSALYALSTPYSTSGCGSGTHPSGNASGNPDGSSYPLSTCNGTPEPYNGIVDGVYLVEGYESVYVYADDERIATPLAYMDAVNQYSTTILDGYDYVDAGLDCQGGQCKWVSQSTIGESRPTNTCNATIKDSVWGGSWDNIFLQSGDATGNIYVLGNHYGPLQLYQVPVSGGSLGTSSVVETNLTNGTAGTRAYGSPVTGYCVNESDPCAVSGGETSAGYDWIIFSVWNNNVGCSGGSTSNGCILSWNVNNPASLTSLSDVLVAAGSSVSPTGRFTIDNTVPSTSNFYTTTTDTAAASCVTSGTSPCVVQMPQ